MLSPCKTVWTGLFTRKKNGDAFSALLKPPFFHLFPLIVTVRTLSDYYSKHRCLFVSEDFRTFLNPNLSLCNEYASRHRLCARRGLFCVRRRRCRVRVVLRSEEDQTGLKRMCSSLIRRAEVMRRRRPALRGLAGRFGRSVGFHFRCVRWLPQFPDDANVTMSTFFCSSVLPPSRSFSLLLTTEFMYFSMCTLM